MRSGGEVTQALDDAAIGVQRASTELAKLITEFHEVTEGPEGPILGTGLQFDVSLKEELAAIYERAIEAGNRPPAEDIREAMAHKAIQTKWPELWAAYHSKKARIDALKSWISNQRAAISASQSVLKGERE